MFHILFTTKDVWMPSVQWGVSKTIYYLLLVLFCKSLYTRAAIAVTLLFYFSVLPSFSGNVPAVFRKLFSTANITRLGDWYFTILSFLLIITWYIIVFYSSPQLYYYLLRQCFCSLTLLLFLLLLWVMVPNTLIFLINLVLEHSSWLYIWKCYMFLLGLVASFIYLTWKTTRNLWE